MKKITAWVLCLATLFTLCTSSFAASAPLLNADSTTGVVTADSSCYGQVERVVQQYADESNSEASIAIYPTESMDNNLYKIANQNTLGLGSGDLITIESVEGTGGIYCDVNSDASIYMQVSSDAVVPAEEIHFDPSDPVEVAQKVDEYELSDNVRDALMELSQQCVDGEAYIDSLTVYIPAEHEIMSRGRTSHTYTRTYTGYNGKKYYEELLVFSGNSTSFNVATPPGALSRYANNVLVAVAEATLSAALDRITGDAWSIVSLFVDLDDLDSYYAIQTQTAYEHTAILVENKSRKWTYVCEGNDKFIGSVLDFATSYKFKNYLSIPGADVRHIGDTPLQERQPEGWTRADELAYRNFNSGAYTNYIPRYSYKNDTYNLSASVASLLK